MKEKKIIYYENGCYIKKISEVEVMVFISFESVKNKTHQNFINSINLRLNKDFNYNTKCLNPKTTTINEGIIIKFYNNIIPFKHNE